MKFLCLLFLVGFASAVPDARDDVASLVQTWDQESDTVTSKAGTTTQASPVQKVVKLLQEMQDTLKKEMEEDEEIYDKLDCWCNTNDAEKTDAIKQAEAQIADLEATIEELTARGEELRASIKDLEAELASDKEELDKAVALRDKQLKEFHAEEMEGIQVVENLKAAIMVLSRHHGAFPQLALLSTKAKGMKGRQLKKGDGDALDGLWGTSHESRDNLDMDRFMSSNGFNDATDSTTTSKKTDKFLQQNLFADSPPAPAADAAAVSAIPQADGFTIEEVMILKKAKSSVMSLTQQKGLSRYADEAQIFTQAGYAPQSGEILGILKQLKEEFEGNLSESQKQEMERAAAFAELRASKQQEIAAGEKMLDEKTQQLAETDTKNAEAKEQLEDTKNALSADQKFIIMLKKTCAEGDKDWALRKKNRMEEMKAISETIEMLMSDDFRDAANSTYNFLQKMAETKESRSVKAKRSEASKILKAAAKQNPELSVLATNVQIDAFFKVKKAMDDMIANLKQQQADEVKKHDYCGATIQANEMETAKKTDMKGDLEVQIDDLKATIQNLGTSIDQAKAAIAQAQVDLQRANENRKKENQEFQKLIVDQRATQDILKKALNRLATFYDSAAFLQMQKKRAEAKKQEPPAEAAQLKGYEKSAGGSGVMSMIEKLIYDAKDLEKDAINGENDAQAAYTQLADDTNALVDEKTTAVVNMSEEKAGAEKEVSEKGEALEGVEVELKELREMNGGLHEECDFLLKNFDARQQGRQAEIEAIQQAKAILSGAMQ